MSVELDRLSEGVGMSRAVNASLRGMKHSQSGFTLVELMVTVAIGVVLASLAVPGFQTMLSGRQVESAIDTLASDFRYARSEAIRRTNRVTICASSNGTSCTEAGGLWRDGWIIFVDDNGDSTVDAGEDIVRVQGTLPGIAAIAATNGTSRSSFVFQPTGWAQSASQTFLVTPSGSGTARLLCISNKGRPGIRPKGDTSCS